MSSNLFRAKLETRRGIQMSNSSSEFLDDLSKRINARPSYIIEYILAHYDQVVDEQKLRQLINRDRKMPKPSKRKKESKDA